MSIFDGLMGNDSRANNEKIQQKLEDVLMPNEKVDLAFKLVRDLIVFTDHRLIIIDKQGLTGKKVQYKSLPYKSISHFSIETTGHFDLDAELSLWISSTDEPCEVLQFRKDKNIVQIQQALTIAILT